MSRECPCCSGAPFDACCGPLLAGERKAATAEELMRSRYTAHVEVVVPYIMDTVVPAHRPRQKEKHIREWAQSTTWTRLVIHATEAGTPSDDKGMVHFTAYFLEDGKEVPHEEKANFIKEDGAWYFDDGLGAPVETIRHETPKTKGNDPCTCGSGRKFKKCCGR